MKHTPFVLGLAGALALSACAHAPRGSSGGRLSPSTEHGETASQVNVVDFQELADAFTSQLAQDIAALPDIQAAGNTRKVMEIGAFTNKTSTSSNDFEQFMSMVRSRIQQSSLLRQHLMIVSSRSRNQANLNRTQGQAGPDLLDEGAGGPEAVKYRPEDTYMLGGTFSEIRRGGVWNYFLQVELSNLATREIIYQETLEQRRRL